MTAAQISRDKLITPIYIAVILTCLIIAYPSIFQKLIKDWSSGDNSYCYLVVPLFLYLLYDRRERYRFNEFSWSIWGLMPVCLTVILILIGELGSVVTFLYIGIWGCVVGLAWCLYGWRIRYLVYPLIILLFIVPLPPYINRMLTFQLKLAASTLATLMLRVSGMSVFQDGNIIDLGIRQLQVVDACSGLRYLIPLLLLALLVGHFFSTGLWRKAILIFLVIPISVFLNAFRIWVTGILTVNGHAELAENLFHDFTGWLIFMIAGAILFGVTLIFKRVGSKPEKKTIVDPGSRPVGLARPIALTAIICLMFIGSGWALKQIPSARNLPPRTAFKSFPTRIGDWTGKKSYLSKEIMEQLWADDYVNASFSNHNSRNIIYLFIPFYDYQGTRHTAHAPQSCLLGGGWALLNSQKRLVNLNPQEPIKIMTMTLEKGSSKVLGSYFFFQRGRVITSPWLNKFYLMWDSFKKGRTDGALVRVEMVLAPGQSVEEGWTVLEEFIAKLWPILPEYVPE